MGLVGAATCAALFVGAAASVTTAPSTEADPNVLAAGDVANCDGDGDPQTAAIIDQHPNATVAALGDLAYYAGTPDEFQSCYEPTWGRHKGRTRPAPGNHEYGTPGAAGYFGYFGSNAGPAGKGWYSYDLGTWHVVVLNSNCDAPDVDCGPDSEQLQWLRADLAAHPADCTLAYWHHPLFTSGFHAGDENLAHVRPFWDVLYEHGADVILNGHDHNYERFYPQTPTGARTSAYGIRQFVVGTGGASLRPPGGPFHPNAEVFDWSSDGLLKLVLGAGTYSWEFLAEPGGSFRDAGANNCHGAPDLAPPEGNPSLASSHGSSWSNDNTVQVSWTGASDSGSGVDGFSYSFTQGAGDSPGHGQGRRGDRELDHERGPGRRRMVVPPANPRQRRQLEQRRAPRPLPDRHLGAREPRALGESRGERLVERQHGRGDLDRRHRYRKRRGRLLLLVVAGRRGLARLRQGCRGIVELDDEPRTRGWQLVVPPADEGQRGELECRRSIAGRSRSTPRRRPTRRSRARATTSESGRTSQT